MIDRKTRIIATIARQEQERAWLFEEANILDHLEQETGICGERFKVSSGILWGARSITVGDSLGFNKVEPSLQDLRAIATALKPRPLMLIKAGCTSFQPKETLTEKDTKYGTLTEVAPFYVTLERNQRLHIATVTWYAKVLNVLYRIQFHYPDKNNLLGRINAVKVSLGLAGGVQQFIWQYHCSWPADEIYRNEKVVGNAKQIKWHSCGEYPYYSRYWKIVDRRYSLTPVDLLNTLEVACV